MNAKHAQLFHSTRHRVAVIAATAFFTASAGLQAAVIANYNGGATAGATALDGQISATDLVNTGQSTLLSISAPLFPANGSTVGLNDGSAAALIPNMTFYTDSNFPASVTFTLNTTINSLGYDITTINTFAGWVDADFGAQKFELFLKTTTNDFVSYGTFSNTAGFNNTSQSSLTTLTSDSGPIASGVTDVRLVYSQAVSYGTVIREIDVVGVASVPEPSTWLMIAGAGALILCQRRGRFSHLAA